MKGFRLLAITLSLAVSGGFAHAQMTGQDARAEGEAIGTGVRDSTNGAILSNGAEANVPTFAGTNFPTLDYVEDPVGLTAAGEAARYQQDYKVVVDPYRTVVDPATIDLSAASAIEKDPDTYLGPGAGLGGATGTCSPLPPGGGGATTYLESCNQGSQPFDETRSCRAPLDIVVDSGGPPEWRYECDTIRIPTRSGNNSSRQCSLIAPHVTNGICRQVGEGTRLVAICLQGVPGKCTEPDFIEIPTEIYNCSQTIAFPGGRQVGGVPRILSEAVDETQCQSAISGATCTLDTETCTAPNETRTINGLAITRPCWEWSRTYQCQGVAPANDCTALEARPECVFDHDECLSYDQNGACSVYDRWFQCTTPTTGPPPPPAYVCAGDLYCINGECNTVTREASTEFKDAMVAMNVMGELRDGFDPSQLKIFSGEGLKCTKKLFGLSNCCSGKGVPLLTPWLCNSEDRDVDKRDDAGLCHYVGTYCSSKVLGICTTKKQSYCCYGSKLVRILNEQGKAQLGMQWGTPKTPDCEGFLIAQFQQLDLSRMDFSEVYAEFVDAAKLPDEIEMSLQIQEKIENYYNLNGGN